MVRDLGVRVLNEIFKVIAAVMCCLLIEKEIAISTRIALKRS